MPRKTIFFLTTILLCGLVTLSAGAQQLLNDKIDVKAGTAVSDVNAVIYLPANYSSSKKYPLVIYTHGVGEAGSDINLMYHTGLPKVLKGGYKPSFEFIMVAPQRSSYSVDPAWLEGILESSSARWSIDQTRIYLTGISAGGWGTYGSQLNISPEFANKFAAIMVYAANDANSKKENFDWWKTSKTPLWAVVGGSDSYYVGRAKFMTAEVNNRVPGLAQLSIRPGYGHSGWDDVYNGSFKLGDKTLWDWFYQYTSGSTFSVQPSTSGSSTPVESTSTAGNVIPGKVEAESYSLMSGVKTETTTDLLGGLNVGYFGQGDWMEYTLTVGATGTYTVNFRVATRSSGSQLQLRKQDGTVLATVNVPLTGGNQVWKTISSTVSLTAGTQKLRVFLSACPTTVNLNWFEFVSTGSGTAYPQPDPEPTPTGTYANYTLTGGSQIYYPNGLNISNLKPGDTVNIPAGRYSLIDLGNFKGDAAHPIIIRNKGGQVIVEKVRLGNQALSQYFKFLGNGTPGITYGFKISGGGQGITANKASDFEIAYCEISNVAVGIMSKINPVEGDLTTQYPYFTIRNVNINHNYIHDISGEAMYIGHTAPAGGQAGNPLIPVQHQNVEIAYNTVDKTTWDGIQLNNATSGNKVHHNTVSNFGTLNNSGQRTGITFGGNTTGDVYDNTVKYGTGVGIAIGGYGKINVYNNVVENVGRTGTADGDNSIYCNDWIYFDNPKQENYIYNNTVRNPMPRGAIRISNNRNNTLPGAIQNNKLLIPNATSTWQAEYISGMLGTVISGNTLITQ